MAHFMVHNLAQVMVQVTLSAKAALVSRLPGILMIEPRIFVAVLSGNVLLTVHW